MTWTPYTEEQLYDIINAGESRLNGPYLRLWDLGKITPVKWREEQYGKIGDGFWAVGIIGSLVNWYNDIENGFNISPFHHFTISTLRCNKWRLLQPK